MPDDSPSKVTIADISNALDALDSEIAALLNGKNNPAAHALLSPVLDAITYAMSTAMTLHDENEIARQRREIQAAENRIAEAQDRIEKRRKGDPT